MTFVLASRLVVPSGTAELAVIRGDDESTWVRLEREGELVAVWSAERQGFGVVGIDRVVRALAHAATADDVRTVTDHMKFSGWEFWPGVPAPVRDYLLGEFERQRAEAAAEPAY